MSRLRLTLVGIFQDNGIELLTNLADLDLSFFRYRFIQSNGEYDMPSFDVVSEFEKQELTNAINQANRELETRFDFKKIKAKFELDECNVVMRAEVDFQLKQMQDILESKLVKRGIDIMCMDVGEVESNVAEARVTVSMRQGLDKDVAKKVVKLIKESKTKVQSAIQGDKVRVTGKKRDDLQKAISLLKEADFNIPLQFNNFRD